MKLKHIIAVTVGAAALCAPSCDLDEKFYSEVTPDTFFTSPESTYAVLCRPFTHWKWYIGADRWYLQELTTDEMVCPKRGSDWYNSGEYYRLHYHTWSPDDRFVVNPYDGTTGGISRARGRRSAAAAGSRRVCPSRNCWALIRWNPPPADGFAVDAAGGVLADICTDSVFFCSGKTRSGCRFSPFSAARTV